MSPSKPKPLRRPPTGGRSGIQEAMWRKLSALYAALPDVEANPGTLREALVGAAVITPALKEASGGLPHVVTALRAFDDEDAEAWLGAWDQLTSPQQRVAPWEAVALAAGISPSDLLGVAVRALAAYAADVTKIILSASLPGIVRKSIKVAMTSKGIDDRTNLLKAGAVLPVPKGSQVALQINVPVAEVKELAAGPEPPQPWDQERRLKELHEAWGTQTALPPAPPAHGPLPATVDAIQQRAAEATEDV